MPDGSERHGTLEHPANRQRLIQSLVEGDQTMTELAAEHGVTYQAVQQFALRHVDRIRQMSEEHAYGWAKMRADQLAGLDRVMIDVLSRTRWDGDTAHQLRTVQEGMRQVADDLERCPDRISLARANGVA